MRSSKTYDEHLEKHIGAVQLAYRWLLANIPDVFDGISIPDFEKRISEHDSSKYSEKEYAARVECFENNEACQSPAYLHARLDHVHANEHHWQHWVLICDDGSFSVADIPKNCILEMICDWWSYSLVAQNPRIIFSWYDCNKGNIILSESTRKTVEEILDSIDTVLDENTKTISIEENRPKYAAGSER